MRVPYQRARVPLWGASGGRVSSRAWGSQLLPCPLLPCGSDSPPDCCKTARVSAASPGPRGVERRLGRLMFDGAASVRPLCPLVIKGTGKRWLSFPQPCAWGPSPAAGLVLRWWGWTEGRVLTTWWWCFALLAPKVDISGGRERGTLGPGSSLFQCLYHVLTVEAELFWKAQLGWEKTGLFPPPPTLSSQPAGSYYKAKTGSGESLEAGFLREAQGLGSDCVLPLRLG